MFPINGILLCGLPSRACFHGLASWFFHGFLHGLFSRAVFTGLPSRACHGFLCGDLCLWWSLSACRFLHVLVIAAICLALRFHLTAPDSSLTGLSSVDSLTIWFAGSFMGFSAGSFMVIVCDLLPIWSCQFLHVVIHCNLDRLHASSASFPCVVCLVWLWFISSRDFHLMHWLWLTSTVIINLSSNMDCVFPSSWLRGCYSKCDPEITLCVLGSFPA